MKSAMQDSDASNIKKVLLIYNLRFSSIRSITN